MRKRDEFIEQVRDWASARPDVCAALLVGSAARSSTPADEWSDVDVVLFVDDPAPYFRDAEWLSPFGTLLLTFIEPTATGGSRERRVLFEEGIEADFAVFPAEAIDRLSADEGANSTLQRGYRVLVDHVQIESRLQRSVPQPAIADAAVFAQLANDFWYHALWAAKKLCRGELWVARSCVDCYLHARLIEMTALNAQALDPMLDTWHGGRFVERWAGADVVTALWGSLVRGPDDIGAAIRRSVALFDRLVDETAPRLGVRLELRRAEVRRRLDAVPALESGRGSGH